MGNRRFLGGMLACAAALATALSGCGAQGPAAPSSLDPANLAPAGSVFYLSLSVRPQGDQRSAEEQTLRKLLGPNADSTIRRQVGKIMRRGGIDYGRDVRPWLGQRIGLVLTQLTPGAPSAFSRSAFAMIAPTSDPGAARAFIARQFRRHPSPGETGGVIGHYAVVGGQLAYQSILATAHGHSLASTPGYQATAAQAGPDPAAVYYVSLAGVLRSLAGRMASAGPPLAGILRQELARLSPDAAAGGGLTLSPQAIKLDALTTGVRHAGRPGAAANVATLPGGSWLALATGGRTFSGAYLRQIESGFNLGLSNSLAQRGLAGPLASALTSRFTFIERDLLPAIGPLSLSVAGTSPLDLSAGLELTPGDLGAATRLLGMLRTLLARNPALGVSGSASDFSVTLPTGGRLQVDELGRHVVATYGYADQQAFLHPTASLSGSPGYERAVSELPSGSSVPFYMTFGPITTLVGLLDHSPSAPRALAILHRLSYVIAGGHAGHARIVLGLS